MKIIINCNLRTQSSTVKGVTIPYQIPENWFIDDKLFDDITNKDIEGMIHVLDKLDIEVLDFHRDPQEDIEGTLFHRYRIHISFEDTGYIGTFIYEDYESLIDLDQWKEWGCNSPFHDTIIEQLSIKSVDQPLLIKDIEYLGEEIDWR